MPKVPMCPRRRRLAVVIPVLLVLLSIIVPSQVCFADPGIALQDLDLGEVGRGIVRQSSIQICNTGDGQLTFSNPGGSLVTGLGDGFSVSSKDLEKLAAASLGAGECFRLPITFISTTPGAHSATIRVWANTRATRDTATLRSTVTEPNPQLFGFDFGERQVASATNTCTKNTVADYEADIYVVNLGIGALTVDRIELSGDGIGAAMRLDTSAGAPRIRRGDVLAAATSADTARLTQRIRFAPDTERAFSAIVAIAFTDGSTVHTTITGIGLERHIGVSDTMAFGVVAAAALPQRRSIVVSADGSAPVTITGARISGDAAFSLVGGVDALPVTLAPGSTHTFEVELRRATDGYHEATFEVLGDHSRCDDSTMRITAILTGIGGIDGSLAPSAIAVLAVAPNVAADRATVRFTLAHASRALIEIVGPLGERRTLYDAGRLAAGPHAFDIDLSPLASGHYSCVLTAGGARASTGLLIVR